MTITAPSKFFNKKYDAQHDSKPKCNAVMRFWKFRWRRPILEIEKIDISLNFELFIPLLKIYKQIEFSDYKCWKWD